MQTRNIIIIVIVIICLYNMCKSNNKEQFADSMYTYTVNPATIAAYEAANKKCSANFNTAGHCMLSELAKQPTKDERDQFGAYYYARNQCADDFNINKPPSGCTERPYTYGVCHKCNFNIAMTQIKARNGPWGS
jgi:hypothetical protein